MLNIKSGASHVDTKALLALKDVPLKTVDLTVQIFEQQLVESTACHWRIACTGKNDSLRTIVRRKA